MGCGMTKLNREDASGPMYLYYNPMHRNMEDLQPFHGTNKKNDDQGTTTKSLLEDGGGHEHNYIDNHHETGHDEVSLPRMSNAKSECMAVKQSPMQQTMHVKAANESYIEGDPHNNNELVDEEKKKKVMIRDEGDKVDKENTNDDDNDEIHDSSEKEDGDDSDGGNNNNNNDNNNNNEVCVREASIFYPGSPSFREYCVVSVDSEDSCKNGGVDKAKREMAMALQNKNDDFTATEPLKAINKDDDHTATEPMKLQSDPAVKKNRARRLRGVLTGRGGMKNLLHVAACNPHRSFSGNKVT